jgi:hypothetical protein
MQDSPPTLRLQKKKTRTKYEEFPKIEWNNNSNSDIQTCILLYDDRVKTYRRMQEIDVLIDEQPEFALEMVNCSIRNREAHDELQAYNDHHLFIYKHDFTKKQKIQSETLAELYELKRSDPDAFITETANIIQNMRRIESNLRTAKYKSDDEKKRWEDNLMRAKIRYAVLTEVLSK